MPIILTVLVFILVGCVGPVKNINSSTDKINHSGLIKAIALNNKGVDRLERNEIFEAEKYFKQGLEWDGKCGALHNNLGVFYFKNGDLYNAALEFQCAVKSMQNKPEAMNNIGLVFESALQLEKAIEWYQEALKIKPNSTEILGNYARARIKNGDTDNDLRNILNSLIIKDPRKEWSSWAKKQSSIMQVEDN